MSLTDYDHKLHKKILHLPHYRVKGKQYTDRYCLTEDSCADFIRFNTVSKYPKDLQELSHLFLLEKGKDNVVRQLKSLNMIDHASFFISRGEESGSKLLVGAQNVTGIEITSHQ